jgi:hypothetical protein
MPVRVRLTRKFAQIINGIDLTRARAGEELELTDHEAYLLIAEGWADPIASADEKQPRRSRRARKSSAEG